MLAAIKNSKIIMEYVIVSISVIFVFAVTWNNQIPILTFLGKINRGIGSIALIGTIFMLLSMFVNDYQRYTK